MFETVWKKIIRRRGLSLWAIPAFGLWLCSIIYRLAFRIKRAITGPGVKVDVPVVSIGNVTVGGTGKTSMVQFLARGLLTEGVRVGVVSSGYGRRSELSFVEPGYRVQKMSVSVTGDEVMLLASLLPEAVFAVDRIKSTAVANLARTESVDLILVDDGFQHFKLRRDLDIVTFDAAVKERYLKPFPLGLLREPLSALNRADVLVITRSNFAPDLGLLKENLRGKGPCAALYCAQFLVSELVGSERHLPVKYLEDKSVFLFAGVGNFRPLKKQVAALCADLDCALELSDHQQYNKRILSEIKTQAERYDSDVIITTGKDWVKLPDFAFGREIYYLAQSIDLDPGEEKLVQYLLEKFDLNKREA